MEASVMTHPMTLSLLAALWLLCQPQQKVGPPSPAPTKAAVHTRKAAATPSTKLLPPHGQRMLKGDDATRAKEIRRKIGEAQKTERWSEAIAAAKELAALRRELQGSDHWETFDTEQQIRDLEWLAHLPQDKLRTLLSSN